MIVDAQVHVWKANSPDRPWVPSRDPHLPDPLTIEKLVAMMGEAGVDRTILVPPIWDGYRNDYALEAAARFPGRFAVMGRIPLDNPQSATLLPIWTKHPGMVGVRLAFVGHQAAWIDDGTADRFWPAAEQYGIPVMVFRAPASYVARVAQRHPHLALIVDHFGLAGDIAKREGGIGSGIAETITLAKYENVSLKVSSAPFYSSEPYPFRDMSTHIRRVFDAYGPRRCHWGTDLSHSLSKASYRQHVTHFTETLDFLSEDDKQWIMGRSIATRLGWA